MSIFVYKMFGIQDNVNSWSCEINRLAWERIRRDEQPICVGASPRPTRSAIRSMRQKKMQLVKPLADGTTMVKVHKLEEKGSDVNLATYLLLDAFQGEYDGAAVITNDSDLVEPIRIVRDVLGKRVEVLDPCGDGRTSAELAKVATFYKPVRLGAISASLFPDSLTDAKGTFRKPAPW